MASEITSDLELLEGLFASTHIVSCVDLALLRSYRLQFSESTHVV
jgi:hypothetical protein